MTYHISKEHKLYDRATNARLEANRRLIRELKKLGYSESKAREIVLATAKRKA